MSIFCNIRALSKNDSVHFQTQWPC